MIGGVDLIGLLIQIVVGIIILAPVLWLVGRALVGKEKAKFLDAVWIVALGTVIGAVVGSSRRSMSSSENKIKYLGGVSLFGRKTRMK